MLAVPLVKLTEVMISGSPSTSLSLTSAWIVTDTSSSVFVKSFTATGGSFTPVTVMLTIALAVLPLPSHRQYAVDAVPLKLAAGVNTTFVPAMLAVPLVGLTEVMINGSPSTSLSLTSAWIVTDTSSTVFVKSFTATGGSFTGVTVMLTVATPELVWP